MPVLDILVSLATSRGVRNRGGRPSSRLRKLVNSPRVDSPAFVRYERICARL